MHNVQPSTSRIRSEHIGALSLCVALSGACGGEPIIEDGPVDYKTDSFRVAADPPGGAFSGPVSVSLHAEVPATIYYTTDGEPPTANGILYEGPFDIEGDVMLRAVAVDSDGVWSKGTIEHYEPLELTLPPRVSPRILSLSRPHVYFSAEPGDQILEQTIVATSVGSHHVMIHRAYITASTGAGNFYEPGIFQLETHVAESTLLAPGESMELRISYRATETLRSAALSFETDDMRTDTGVHSVELSGRIFNW